jgi:hypothetical protein
MISQSKRSSDKVGAPASELGAARRRPLLLPRRLTNQKQHWSRRFQPHWHSHRPEITDITAFSTMTADVAERSDAAPCGALSAGWHT